MNIETTARTEKEQIEVVLNGGKDTMDSATIPFRWFLSPKLCEAQPTHILVIDLDDQRAAMSEHYAESMGQRQIVEVGQAVDFIQFTAPGWHRLAFVALRITKNGKKYSRVYLNKDETLAYSKEIPWEELEKYFQGHDAPHQLNHDDYITPLAITILKVDVPEEFFAKKSESALGQLIWGWVNRWCTTAPRDECEFRKRAIWAFTLQLPLIILGRILQYGIYAPLSTLYLWLSKAVALVIGYRPKRFSEGLATVWQWDFDPEQVNWDMIRYDKKDFGVWLTDWDAKDGKEILFPFTGTGVFVWLMAAFLAMVTVGLILAMKDSKIESLILIAFIGLFTTWFAWTGTKMCYHKMQKTSWGQKILKFLRKRQKAPAFKAPPPPAPDYYFDWLKAMLSMEQKPSRIVLTKVPRAFRNPVIQRFRIGFWATKAKICKPYAK